MKREPLQSAKWALILAIPISVFGWAFSMALAHSSSVFPLLFYWPAYLVLVAQDHFKPLDELSDVLFGALVLTAQVLGYFVMVLAFRCLIRVWANMTSNFSFKRRRPAGAA